MKKSLFFLILSLALTKVFAQDCSCITSSKFLLGGYVQCDGSPYKLVFFDEFNGTSLDLNKWYTFYPYGDNNSDQCEFCRTHGGENQIYRDANVVVSNGTAKLRALKEAGTWFTATRPYTSGMIQSKQSFKYGKFEIRCKLPSGVGFGPAFWMFGGDELDIFEYCSGDPDDQVMTLHMDCGGNCQTAETHDGINSSDGFHTYSVEWADQYVIWKTDGEIVRSVKRLTSTDGLEFTCGDYLNQGLYYYNNLIPNNSMNVIADLAVTSQGPGANAGCNGEVPNDDTQFPADFEIDYIRVWQRTPQADLSDVCSGRGIEGSSSICNGQQSTYKFIGQASALTWTVSPNLSIVGQTANSVTVQPANNTSSGQGWVKVQAGSDPPCDQTQFTKNVTIGKPIVEIFVTLDCVFTELDALVQPDNLVGVWSITTQRPYTISGNNVAIRGARYFPSNYSYVYSVANGCGTTSVTGHGTIPSCYSPQLLVSPNPANGNIIIKIEGDVTSEDIDYLKLTSQYTGASTNLIWNNQDINLNLSGYTSGPYVVSLKFKDSNDILSQQVVIQK